MGTLRSCVYAVLTSSRNNVSISPQDNHSSFGMIYFSPLGRILPPEFPAKAPIVQVRVLDSSRAS